MAKYKITAECKRYTQWDVDNQGNMTWLIHEYEGDDLMYYAIVDEDNNIIEDDLQDYASAKARLNDLILENA